MAWLNIPQYAEFMGLPLELVQKQVEAGTIQVQKSDFGFYIWVPDDIEPPRKTKVEETTRPFSELQAIEVKSLSSDSGVDQIVNFSSKALHHYLVMTEKLVEEKDIRIREKEETIRYNKEQIAELEAYVKMLENILEAKSPMKNKPEGWK